jgi:hypothetical protein
MSWECPECGYSNKDYLFKCVCGYDLDYEEINLEAQEQEEIIMDWEKVLDEWQNFWKKVGTIGSLMVGGGFILLILMPSGLKRVGRMSYPPDLEVWLNRFLYGQPPLEAFAEGLMYLGFSMVVSSVVAIAIGAEIKKRKEKIKAQKMK